MIKSVRWRWVLLALSGLFATLVVRTAWLSDDAYITLRTVDNVVSGHGLRWNVVERVQPYTHPLWMLLVAVPYAVTREPYFTPLLLQVALSLAAFGLLAWRLAVVPAAAALGLLVLCFSKAFVEYSTSGLENPLTHLLLVVFFLVFWQPAGRGRVGLIWLVTALLMVNRLDTGLLVLPAAAWASWQAGWRATVPAAVVGLLPLVAWETFSVIYYGFPFPNTAYAKLQTGYTTAALLGQGARYFLDSILRDPVTLPATAALSAMAMAVRPRESAPIVTGMALYAIYVLRIGGDFMSGRFFSALLLCAVVLGARTPWRLPRWATAAGAAAVVVLGTFVATRPPITSGANTFILSGDEGMGVGQVADERAFYYRYTGLLRWTRAIPLPHNGEEVRGRHVRAAGDRVVVQASVGLFGFFAGPDVHIVDPLALADPLLARLPAKPGMRVGHYERELPEGYVETLMTGRNVIADPAVAAAYERLRWVTQGPLWTRRRWRAIRALNLGPLVP